MDLYLLLTPILMLIIIALLGFVGCDIVFGLDRVENVIPAPLNFTATPGDNVVSLDWDAVTNADSYTVKRGVTSGVYPVTFSAMAMTEYVDDTAVNGTTYFYVVFATDNGNNSQLSEEREVTPMSAALTSLVTSKTLNVASLRNNFTSWVGMGFVTAGNALTVHRLGRLYAPNNVAPHVVKLVDGVTKADLPGASAIVSLPAGTVNEFVYGNLASPVQLAENSKYYLLSQEISGGDRFYDSPDTSITTTADVVRVFAVNGDGMGTVNESPIDNFVYGPVDIQYTL